MKKVLFVLAFAGAAMFSTLQAGNNLEKISLENKSIDEDFCRVVRTVKQEGRINSDGSTTLITTITDTFYPCSN